MSLESSEVVVGGTGHVYRAPVGTAFPTNISTAVNDSLWTELGYANEDGIKFTFGREVNEIMAWQAFDPLRIIVTKIPKEIEVTFLQTNMNTWATAQGGGTWTEPTANNFLYEPPDEDYVDEFQYICAFEDDDLSYRFCFRKVMNQAGIEFSVNRQIALQLPVTVKVLAADSGYKPWFLQTNDENMGDYTLAGS